MSIVSYTTIGGGLIGPDKRALRRFFMLDMMAVSKKREKYRRDELKNLPTYSLLTSIGSAWGLLSEEEKAGWEAAGAVCGLTGYNLFTQDKSYRIKNLIAGNADPSIYHQYLIGHLSIGEGAGDVHLKQTGNTVFEFPINLYISRKTALIADPVNGEFVKVRFCYSYDEGGGPVIQTDELSLSLSDGWDNEVLGITEHEGQLGVWSFEIETHAVKGDLYFDNFYIGIDKAWITKDPFCQAISKRWQMVKFPAGVVFESLYPQGEAL